MPGLITVLLAVAFAGSRLSATQAVAVAVDNRRGDARLCGISATIARISPPTACRGSGSCSRCVQWGCWGTFVFGVSYYRSDIGWLGPIFLARGFAAAFLFGHLLCARRWARADSGAPSPDSFAPMRPRGRLIGLIALLAVLDTGGYVCFNLGVGHASTAIVAAASAPYAVVPIVMGVSLFRERPTPTQWLGAGAVIAGVVFAVLP